MIRDAHLSLFGLLALVALQAQLGQVHDHVLHAMLVLFALRVLIPTQRPVRVPPTRLGRTATRHRQTRMSTSHSSTVRPIAVIVLEAWRIHEDGLWVDCDSRNPGLALARPFNVDARVKINISNTA